jgi:chromosome segregation ATPase
MAVEIAALLGAARVAAGLVKDVHGLVGNIRSGMLAKNDDAKRQLDEKLTALQQSLRDAARLAEFGEEYAGVQQEVVELLWDCERVRASLRENLDATSDAADNRYDSAWQMVESVERRQEPLFRALDDRIAWLNDKDMGQIQQRLHDAARAVEGAAQAVRSKAAADADMHLRRIVDELRRVQSSLNDTLRKGIFGSLEELAR